MPHDVLIAVLLRLGVSSINPVDDMDLPPIVMRAAEILVEHAADDFSTSDLAAELGLSPRALQYGFREYLGESPMGVLRLARLEHARLDLERLESASGQVTAVAAKYHLHHGGRFAALYRHTYGELPSESLAHEPTAD